MLWFTVWLVLVLLTLAGAALLGRRLWRSGAALGRELEKAADLAQRLEQLQAELEERYGRPTPPTPDLDAGSADRARFHAMRHAHREAVRRRRRMRLVRATRHWRSLVAPRR